MKVTNEIYALVPEEYRDKCGINWNGSAQKFYVFLRLGYRYDPTKKRSVDLREPLGSIKDGVFTYGPSFAKKMKISKLEEQVKELKQKDEEKTEKLKDTASKISKATATVIDPRQNAKSAFPLEIILSVAMLAAFGGITDAVGISLYWERCKQELGILFDNFPEELISHDTINRIFRLINPNHLSSLLEAMVQPLIANNAQRLIHIDGQAVRASKTDQCEGGRYLFNAYDSENHLLLQHLLIDEKENEISNSTDLLSALDLRSGDIITADAMNTQRSMVEYVTSKGAGYCLAVKGNHEKLHKEVTYLFASTDDSRCKTYSNTESGHGRIDERTTKVLPASMLSPRFKQEWPALQDGVIVMTRTVTSAKSKRSRNSDETRYFICSIPWKDADCAAITADIIRRHWSIENSLHWVLDNDFRQDRIQASDPNYLSNRVLFNKIALNVLKTAQKYYQNKDGRELSIQSLLLLCGTPAAALKVFSDALDLKRLLTDAKVNS